MNAPKSAKASSSGLRRRSVRKRALPLLTLVLVGLCATPTAAQSEPPQDAVNLIVYLNAATIEGKAFQAFGALRAKPTPAGQGSPPAPSVEIAPGEITISCRPLNPVGTALQTALGPYLIRVLSEDDPETVAARIQAMQHVASCTPYDLESGILGEAAKSWFPAEATQGSGVFCNAQPYLHFPLENGELEPRLLETGADLCEWYDNEPDLGTPPPNVNEWDQVWKPDDMDFPQAWAITRGNDDVVVVVVDPAGVDWTHPDLGGTGPSIATATHAELMNGYRDGNIFANESDPPGAAIGGETENCPGICGPGAEGDDDGDGLSDEDFFGVTPYIGPEPEIASGYMRLQPLTQFPDYVYSLEVESTELPISTLVGWWLYVKPSNVSETRWVAEILAVNEQAMTITTGVPLLHSQSTWESVNGWKGKFDDYVSSGITHFDATVVDESAKNRLDDDGDGRIDEIEPYLVHYRFDDDENGYPDDTRGWNFYVQPYSATFDGTANDSRPDASIIDGGSHGTMSAGIIGALSQTPGVGTVGVAPSVQILSIRGEPAKLPEIIPYLLTLRDASGEPIVDAICLSVKLIENCSVIAAVDAEGNYTHPIGIAIAAADAAGILLIAGAGNSFESTQNGLGCFDEIISVGGTIAHRRKPWVDGGSQGTKYGSWVDISAPARNVSAPASCIFGDCSSTYGLPSTGTYGWSHFNWGTSLSAPIVSGVAALLKSAYPHLDNASIRQRLLASAEPIDFSQYPSLAGQLGAGVVNAYRALTIFGEVETSTWEGEVWVSGDIHVPAGETLTILPGTVVHVAQDDIANIGDEPQMVEFFIEGSIDWSGTPGAAIEFEQFADSPEKLWVPPALASPTSGTMSHVAFAGTRVDAVTSPNGSESFDFLSNIPITWSVDYLAPQDPAYDQLVIAQSVDILVSIDNGQNWEVVATDLAAVAGTTSWVPNAEGYISGQCLAKVVFKNAFGIVVGADASDAPFTISAPAQFVNRSADAGLTGGIVPFSAYASMPFDADSDGDDDLFLSNDQDEGLMLRNEPNLLHSDLPHFAEQTDEIFGVSDHPFGTRGGDVGDYNADGRADLFLASQSLPRVYRFDIGLDRFVVAGGSLGSLVSSTGQDSWTGSWVDYDRDGRLDLYIGRGGTVSGLPSGGLEDHLLQNASLPGIEHFTGSGLDINSAGEKCTAAAAWADVDGNGEVDLFVGEYTATGLVNSALYMHTVNGQFEHVFTSAPSRLPSYPANIKGISDAEFVDFNSDGNLDLLYAGRLGSDYATRMCWNDGAGYFTSSGLLAGALTLASVTATDLDLDGTMDILGTPITASTPLRALRNQVGGSAPTFVDEAASLGLDDVSTQSFRSVATADFAHPQGATDGDLDLFVGRPSAVAKSFYQNTAAQPMQGSKPSWLAVRLSSSSDLNNESGIGSSILVQSPPGSGSNLKLLQLVGGGNGSDGNAALAPVFGLGTNLSSDVEVIATWPDGTQASQILSPSQLRTTITLNDDHLPGLIQGSEIGYALVDAGGIAHLIFEFESLHNSMVSAVQVVVKKETPQGAYNCTPLAETTLTESSGGVTVAIFAGQNGRYRYRLSWSDQICVPEPKCKYKFKVTCGTPTGSETSNQWRQFAVPLCIQ